MNVHKIIENSKIVSFNYEDCSCSDKKVVEENEENKIVGVLAQNISTRITRSNLMKVFQAIGVIHSIDMHVDATGFPLGSAIIKFEDSEDAVKAHQKLNRTLLDGQGMVLMVLREKQESSFLRKMHKTGKITLHTNVIDMDFMKKYQRTIPKVKKEIKEMDVDAMFARLEEISYLNALNY